LISKSYLADIDDPRKKNLKLAIKERALASSGKCGEKGDTQSYARSARTVDEKAYLYNLFNVCIDNVLILRYIV
jgi:hypothetical protein